jgi:hypothetical protein
VHSVTHDSPVLDDDPLIDALAELRAAGTAVGLTLSGPRQAEVLERALDVGCDGARLFATVQATWNVLEPSAGEMLAAAHTEGLGVIIKEGVANGRLAPRTQDREVRAILEPIAQRAEVSLDAVALARSWHSRGPTLCCLARRRLTSSWPTPPRSTSTWLRRIMMRSRRSPRIRTATGRGAPSWHGNRPWLRPTTSGTRSRLRHRRRGELWKPRCARSRGLAS